MTLKADITGRILIPENCSARQARKLAQFDTVAAIRHIQGTSNTIVFLGQKTLRRGTEFECRKWALKQRVFLLNA